MKLTGYLYRRFLPVFIGSLAFFSFVLILVDLLMNLWKFIQNQATVSAVLNLMLLYLLLVIMFCLVMALVMVICILKQKKLLLTIGK